MNSRIICILALFILCSSYALAFPLTECGNIKVSGEYILQNDIESDLTCLAIAVDNVVINLDGHSITYAMADGSYPVNPSFEDWTGDCPEHWTCNAPDLVKVTKPAGDQWGYDGDVHVKFDLPHVNQEMEVEAVHLRTGVIYALYADSRGNLNQYVYKTLALKDAVSGEEVFSVSTDSNYSYAIFGTFEPEVDMDVHFQIKVHGDNIHENRGSVTFDNIDIQPYRAYGVALTSGWTSGPAKDFFPYIDDDGFGNSDYVTIKNGEIIQGNKGSESHNIFEWGNNDHLTVQNVTGYAGGVRSVGIDGYIEDVEIYNNTLFNTGTRVVNRHQYIGAIHTGVGGRIHGNIIQGAPQSGIVCSECEVRDNYIYRATQETNGYGWQGGDNSDVYNNTIISDGGRGIHITGDGVSVHDNYIEYKGLPNIEYTGLGYPEHGIKLEGCTNSVVYNNYVLGIAPAGYKGVNVLDIGLGEEYNGNNQIYNNTFIARDEGSGGTATALALKGSHFSALNIYNNTFISNELIVGFLANWTNGTLIWNNSFLWDDRLPNTYPISGNYYYAAASNTTFLDNYFGPDVDLTDIRPVGTMYIKEQNYSISYTTRFEFLSVGQPAPNIPFQIDNANGDKYMEGISDENGEFLTVLPQSNVFKPYDPEHSEEYEITHFEPFTITGEGFSQEFSLEQNALITVYIGDIPTLCEQYDTIIVNGQIDSEELLIAIADWYSQSLSLLDLISVIDYWKDDSCPE
ncbi:MAG: right-handed parallel beta-helix repeat-containing protein [Nanoarchaeota archaeon]|nr:right-handed parallel beta-helix repeat-containing protein [Nanoarchaeota archaeon]